jgi:serine/threonine-protein kinase
VTSPSIAPGTLLAGKFRIERALGAGAMGAVYLVEHELTHHKRALKLLHPETREIPDIVRRFLNEASAAGRAGNAHLVETFDAGTLPTGEPYVVMELLEGETLQAALDREGPLAPARAAELVAQAAEGIEAAHRAGIIHRDLKPENLFVTRRDGQPFVKILDFGVSKFVTASSGGSLGATRSGTVMGSPAYMSPEQLTAQDVDERSDVFSLGVVLYECLTKVRPFGAETVEALVVRVLTGELTPIESVRPDVPSALVAIVKEALATDRRARFPSAAALARALGPFRTAPRVAPAIAATSILPPEPMGTVATVELPKGDAPLPVPRNGWRRIAVAGVALGAAAVGVLVAMRPRAPEPRPPEAVAAPAPEPAEIAPPPTVPLKAPASIITTPAARPATPHEPGARAVARRTLPESTKSEAVRVGAPDAERPASERPSAARELGLAPDNPFR